MFLLQASGFKHLEVLVKYIFVLLVLLSVTLASNPDLTLRKTVIVPDNQSPTTKPQTPYSQTLNSQTPNSSTDLVLGRIECVGGTCYDWVNGPCASWCVNDPSNGIHVSWLWSNTEAMSDRNMRYNFYDWSTHTWNWISATNYMNSGIPVFSHVMTSVAGGADLDNTTGNFVICGNYGTSGSIKPELARDLVPGGGLFEYSEGPLGWRWPFIAITQNQAIHVACTDATSTDSLFYTRCSPWGTWSTPINVCPPAPEQMFPNQNIQASKISNKVIITWEESEPANNMDRGYYRLSTDGGTNWSAPTQIPFPPSSLDSPSFHITGFYACFDQNDNFHLATQTAPAGLAWPAEIWHYCPTNNPAWSHVFLRDYDTLAAGVGYNALSACRASITRNPSNNYLYIAWECFDSLNYEPSTSLGRASIWIAESRDNGLTWPYKTRITDLDQTSKRFPVVGGVQVTPSTTDSDTLFILYMVDSIAGAFLQGEHRFCVNPMVLHRVPVPFPTGIEENSLLQVTNFAFQVSPNPFSSNTLISYSTPNSQTLKLQIYDVTGRLVKTLVNQSTPAGNYATNWNRTDHNNNRAPAGIYFVSLKTDDKSITKKITIN
jgi:hypothetical protein